MKPGELGKILREWREKSEIGGVKDAHVRLGVGHSSLGMYERGERLPGIDYLATFSEVTGAPFADLLRLRLAAGKTDAARRLGDTWSGLSSVSDAPDALPREPDPAPSRKLSKIDQALITEIAVELERAYLLSGGLIGAASAFVMANQEAVQEVIASLPEAAISGEIKINGLVLALSQSYPAYAGGVTSLAASIYNEVAGLPSGQERSAAISQKIKMLTLARNLTLVGK